MKPRALLRTRALVLAAAALLVGAPLHAQTAGCGTHRPGGDCVGFQHPRAESRVAAHVQVLGVNAALGALTGGVRRHAAGGSFWTGFLQGAAGGSAIHLGKWISAEPFWGAGLVGRQVAAVGASVVRNASDGHAPLERLMVPVGPVRLYVDRGAGADVQLRLDALAAGALAYRALSADTRFAAGATLSAGTPVFHTDFVPRAGWHGNNTAGVILLLDQETVGTTAFSPEQVFAHERIHMLQYDQAQHTWGSPIEGWILRRIPGGAWIERRVDLGILAVPLVVANWLIPYEDRPWEWEADFFSDTAR